ncbi:MAG: twitching motility protein PilT [Candidatus Syntrophoarchaeum butanivorans]|uniref:Twitching motility protein PilT n=1 Tax=Candidatus Syntropharchaeum butanivorans TaxID=1839936 RepID=A0A1F2P548_9EURY|nr:MAG: twitching motility protein PilT [Candidatus Syntrophoarchaeum butanivorans]
MRLFVDSNVFIFANIKDYPEHRIAKEKLMNLIETESRILINSIIVSEVHYKLSRLLNPEEAYDRTLKILLSDYVEYLPIGEDTILKAIELSFLKNMKINDAIIAQNVLDSGAEGLLTDNVKDFNKISGLKTIEMRS